MSVLLPGPNCLCRPGIERHLVGVVYCFFQPNRAGRRVDYIDDLGEQLGRVLIAGLLGERDGTTQLSRRGVLVAALASLQPFLDYLRELGLPGVMRDLRVDASGQRLVL